LSTKSSTLKGSTRLEGSPESKFLQLIKKHGYNPYDKFELATVISAPPDLKIQIDNMPVVLEKDDVLVAEHLTRHKRIVTITHEEGKERNVGDKFPFPKDHDADGELYFKTEYLELQFEDVLKPGDRVIVASMNDGQSYVILDRLVVYNDGS
jgi:hypothetical protein